MADLAALERTLGVSFNDPSLLEQALIHSSYANENPSLAPVSNERLEFLGDAVLGLIVAEKLYQDFPQVSEGEMTKLRASLVCQDALARVAKPTKLGDHLYLGKGERASDGQHKPSNLARVLEAVIAAVFLDQVITTTREVILKLFRKELQKAATHRAETSYKSQLQEFIQAREQQTPVYRLTEATGPDHEKKFTIEVIIGNTVVGRGTGKSKKLAETEAARAALQQLLGNFTE